MKIFCGNSNRVLAQKICEHLNIPLGDAIVKRFSDGEINLEINESVRGKDIFVIQSTCHPGNDNLMELLIMIDALKRASARRINAVIPYYGYARQDRKVSPRAPISAKLIADLMTAAGATRMMTVDLHAGQIQGFFNIPVDHLYAFPVILDYLSKKFSNGENLVIVSPDAGGVERARAFAKRLKAKLAIIDKRREAANVSQVMNIIGNVEGKTAILLDDMIDTAGTLTHAATALLEHGAKEVYASATHPVLSGKALARLKDSSIKEIVVTDTIPLMGETARFERIKVLSVARLLAEGIHRIHVEDSVSSLFV